MVNKKNNWIYIPVIIVCLVLFYFVGGRVINSIEEIVDGNEIQDEQEGDNQETTGDETEEGTEDSQSDSKNEIGQFTLTWIPGTDGRNGVLDPDNPTILNVSPSENNVYDAESSTGGGAAVTYQVVFNMGGDATAPAGAVNIKLPRNIFFGRDGKAVLQHIDVPLVPYPEEAGTEFNYREETDEEGNEWIILSNYKEIPSTFSFECSISYYLVTPSEVSDTFEKEITGEASLDLDLDGTVDTSSKSNPIHLNYNSHASLYSLSEKYDKHTDSDLGIETNVYYGWNSKWPEAIKPEDADNYFYAIWYFSGSVRYATQPYSILFTAQPVDGLNGKVIAYCSNEYCTGKDVKTYTDGITVSQAKPSSTTNTYSYYGVIVQYPLEPLNDEETHVLKNQVTATLTGVDGATDVKTTTATSSYKFIKIEPPEPTEETIYIDGEIPLPSNSLSKTGSQTISGGINKLELAEPNTAKLKVGYSSYSYSYEVDSYLQAYYLTLKDNGEPAKIEDYGVNKYRYNLIDDKFALGNNEKGYTFLSDDDYKLNYFYMYMYVTDYKYETTVTKNDKLNKTTTKIGWQVINNYDYENWPTVNAYYKLGGEWHELGTLKALSSGTYTFTSIDGITTSKVSSSTPLALPEGTTGIKLTADTNNYSLKMDLYYKAELINSRKVLDIIDKTDSVKLYNFADAFNSTLDGETIEVEKHSSLPNVEFSAYFAQSDIDEYGASVEHKYSTTSLNRLLSVSGSTNENKWVNYTNDVAGRRIKANYTAYAFDYKSYNTSLFTYNDIFDDNIIIEQRDGTFYDLLPYGMTADLDTVKISTFVPKSSSSLSSTSSNISGTGVELDTTVTLIDNYKNSGRTMLIAHASMPEGVSNRHYSSGTAYSGFTLKFTGLYSWDSIYDYGNNLINSVAYQSGSGPLSNGYKDDASSLSNSFIDKKYLSDLDGDGNPEDTISNTVYAQRELSFSVNTASNSAFDKTVKTSAMQSYQTGKDEEVVANAGGYYTYRLRYVSQRNIQTTNLIVYDNFEVFKDETTDATWQGRLVNIDVSQATKKGIAPVIYYSTKHNLNLYENGKSTIDMDVPKDADLTNKDIWSTEPPQNLADVTAIAIDYSKDSKGNDYTVKSEESIVALVTMQAPTKNADKLKEQKAQALNAAWWAGYTQQGKDQKHYNFSVDEHTIVYIDEAKIELHKSSDVESGTKENPRLVKDKDELVYDISVSNTSEHELLSNIVIYDIIPNALNIDEANIAYYIEGQGGIDNPTLITQNELVNLTREDNALTFRISQLSASQTIHIIIPTTVVAKKATKPQIDNTAKIIEFNNIEYELRSETTHHYIKGVVPNTLDNATTYFVLGAVGLIGLIIICVIVIYTKRKQKKIIEKQ